MTLTAFCLSSAVPCSALLERSVAMLESWADTGAGLLSPGYSVTRELCDDVSGGQSCIFSSGHQGKALSSLELDTGCRVLMAGGTGSVARAGTLVTPGLSWSQHYRVWQHCQMSPDSDCWSQTWGMFTRVGKGYRRHYKQYLMLPGPGNQSRYRWAHRAGGNFILSHQKH